MGYIEFQNINKYYGQAHVLKDISLSIEKGELVTLLGSSGCGKSTLLRCLSGLEKTSSGKILIDGKDITNVPPNERNIGMVFQQYSLFPNMTVKENVAFGLKMQKQNPAVIKEKVKDIIDVVGLNEHRNKYPTQLSGGQQQRVALARAIITEPSVLLLDEPLSAIDALLRRNLQVEIRRLHKEFNMTTVFVTHDQDEAMVMSDTIYLMNQGIIEQSGSPVDVYTKPATPFVANFMGHYNYMTIADFATITGVKLEGDNVAVRPEVISISATPKEEADVITFKGKIVGSLSHGNVIRYSVVANEKHMDVDVLFRTHLKFNDNDEVYLNIAKEDILVY